MSQFKGPFLGHTTEASPNSPTLDPTGPAVGDCSCAAQQKESVAAEQAALDEGVDYFSAQGAIDRWKVLNA